MEDKLAKNWQTMQFFTVKLIHQWFAFVCLAQITDQHRENDKETVARPSPHTLLQHLEPLLRRTILKPFVEEDI